MKKNSIVWGLLLVSGGLLFLLNNLGVFTIDFTGWWTLFIIVPSIIGLFTNKELWSNILGIVIGSLLLLATRGIIGFNQVWQVFLPAIIICIGAGILLKLKFPKKNIVSSKGKSIFVGIFGGNSEKITDKFEGGTCISVFGGNDLDLSKAKIKNDVTIEVISVFGGSDIILPKGVIVKTNGLSILGGADNLYKDKAKKGSPTVYINHVSIFGGTDIS
ncbi:MAG: cell wall-active antibiotics response protein [Pseudomonadales bacterium]|jgi:predicted membrane protein|nr:cell wall-active antibiotics response protein [Pseudomonadales bacterium]